MKRNAFGEGIFQPSDDPEDASDRIEGIENAYALISKDSSFGWCAEIFHDGDPLQVHDFETREGLTSWLKRAGITEIEEE